MPSAKKNNKKGLPKDSGEPPVTKPTRSEKKKKAVKEESSSDSDIDSDCDSDSDSDSDSEYVPDMVESEDVVGQHFPALRSNQPPRQFAVPSRTSTSESDSSDIMPSPPSRASVFRSVQGYKMLTDPIVLNFKGSCECGCMNFNTTGDWNIICSVMSGHGCNGKASVEIICKCGVEFTTQIRSLTQVGDMLHRNCQFIPPSGIVRSRAPSDESRQSLDSNDEPRKWYCWEEGCRTRVLQQYKHFTRLKNWQIHMRTFHNADISYENYCQICQPREMEETDVVTEFGNLSIGKKGKK